MNDWILVWYYLMAAALGAALGYARIARRNLKALRADVDKHGGVLDKARRHAFGLGAHYGMTTAAQTLCPIPEIDKNPAVPRVVTSHSDDMTTWTWLLNNGIDEDGKPQQTVVGAGIDYEEVMSGEQPVSDEDAVLRNANARSMIERAREMFGWKEDAE